jgi:DNA primase
VPISMSATWEALARTTAGNQFTILNSKKYLKADPWANAWAEIGKVKQKLPG